MNLSETFGVHLAGRLRYPWGPCPPLVPLAPGAPLGVP